MNKIKMINIKTTDGAWWKLIVDDMSAAKDETIADKILTRFSVSACRIWVGKTEDQDGTPWIDIDERPACINTANIIAIEVIRESEE